ncbi:MAG: hypothetical protein PHW76_02040 [Alphaproteobacteria bacterium]|nr:hypothetical protein [Alphaproteobacteria bacterium]
MEESPQKENKKGGHVKNEEGGSTVRHLKQVTIAALREEGTGYADD